MFLLSFDRFNPSGVDPSGPDLKIAWRVRWVVDVQRLLVIYVPDVCCTVSHLWFLHLVKNFHPTLDIAKLYRILFVARVPEESAKRVREDAGRLATIDYTKCHTRRGSLYVIVLHVS